MELTIKDIKMEKSEFTVGTKNTYNFLAPYDTIMSSITLYEITNISTVRSMSSQGLDPFKNIYELYGISDTDFDDDLSNNVAIVELTLDNSIYYVPINRITNSALVDGVIYSERGIAIKLGFIPSDEVLTTLLPDIVELIKARTGIEAEILDTVLTAEVKIEKSRHDARELARNALKENANNYLTLYTKARTDLDYALGKLQALELAEINSRL